MGGSPGASGDPGAAGAGDGGLLSQLGAGINNNTGLARIAQANPAIGQMLGQMGYTGPSGPQQPVGTGGMLTPSQQSGLNDAAKYGQGMMTGSGIAGGAAPNMSVMPAMKLPQPYAPQAAPMQPIQSPYGGGAGGNMSPAPAWGNRMAAGGANPQFFPYFR